MKYILLISLIISFSYGITCNEYIDVNTGEYDYRCGAQMLGMRNKDYAWTMSLLGGFTGLAFLASIIFIILNIGKSYKVKS
jgi:hypothetical protein